MCVRVRARCHRGFTNAHLRFGDESGGEIIQIPALPLSRSDSLTKLSDPILAPAVRVNLLCHLQSTRGGAASPPLPLPCPCQNSAAVAPKCALSPCPARFCMLAFLTFLCVRLVSIASTWRSLVRYISG